MTLPIFTFDEFVLRPATAEDLSLAKAWTLGDEHHRATTQPGFWIEQKEDTNSYLLVDRRGPVFFFRMDLRGAVVEVHIQFVDGHALTHSRTRRGLMRGFQWLEKMLIESGFEVYYFHSSSPQLIFFCQNRLGFAWDGKKLYRKLRAGNGGKVDPKSRQKDEGQGDGRQVRQGH